MGISGCILINSLICCMLIFVNGQQYQYKCQYLNESNEVLCDGQNVAAFNLTIELENISSGLTSDQKVIKLLEIHNSDIMELPENAFLDLAFQAINIFDAQSFSRIHTNAFSDKMIDNLNLEFYVNNPSGLENLPPNYNLFKALNSLKYVQDIELPLKELTLHEIPDNAFNQTQAYLQWFDFVASPLSNSQGYSISRIGTNSFIGLSNLTAISFRHIQIQNISTNAFSIRDSSDQTLNINLEDCHLIDSSISPDSFVGANRPVTINFAGNNINYIREEKFENFLNENSNNLLELYGNLLNCEDIESFLWLLNNKDKYRQQILGAVCSDGTNLWDVNPGSFSNEFKANIIISLVFILFSLSINL